MGKHTSPAPVPRPAATTARVEPAPPRTPPLTDVGGNVLGRGRSGVVYRDRDARGRHVARKVFESHGLTKLVQWIFLGAPNPYLWCEDAVRCAALRRTLLAELVPLWSDGRVGVAASRGVTWSETHLAFELTADFVRGRPPRLHHPLRMEARGELGELRDEVMRPLQSRLLASGFEGLVWQAGLGNPVALNNFLRRDGDGDGVRWVWIDLESGVPALFPLDPRALLRFYLPHAWRRRRPLFDDVDVDRLRAYLTSDELGSLLPPARVARLGDLAERLAERQARWKGLRRHERSVRYRLARGDIDASRAAYYAQRPGRWYVREASRALRRLPARLARLGRRLVDAARRVPYARIVRGAGRFLVSQRFRYAIARRHVSRRIHAWELRGQMNREDADSLRANLVREESSAYLTDFGVHLAIKPFVKGLEYWVVPTLFALGQVSEAFLAFALLSFGAIARTLYTSGRLVQARLHGRERPWIALLVGMLPIVGNFAYPIQLAWSSTTERDDLARFILHDGFALVGAHLPIWGGEDTLTEHWLNRLPDPLLRLRRRRTSPR